MRNTIIKIYCDMCGNEIVIDDQFKICHDRKYDTVSEFDDIIKYVDLCDKCVSIVLSEYIKQILDTKHKNIANEVIKKVFAK